MRQSFRYYDITVAFYAAILLISNIAATKLVDIGGFILDGGFVLFPLAYIIDDVLTEVYGYRYARRAIWTAFVIMLLAVLTFAAVIALPPAAEYTGQSSFAAVLGFLPRIALASLLAFVSGSLVNAFALARIKVRTKGKMLWLRLIGSTVFGAGLDTVLFCVVAFAGELSLDGMLNYILVGIALKIVVEIVLLPITYRVTSLLKKREGADADDTNTDFAPFHLSVK